MVTTWKELQHVNFHQSGTNEKFLSFSSLHVVVSKGGNTHLGNTIFYGVVILLKMELCDNIV